MAMPDKCSCGLKRLSHVGRRMSSNGESTESCCKTRITLLVSGGVIEGTGNTPT